ncbi:methyltransferase [Streptoalloteichus hindustanus]|uniref:methyltransferase n=1 Tax=Streptoalloteichus hindustanus TaxID=2017 RepID=UPI0009378A9E|nr:methyltransferase [Streptoalloteichus hindustanus]
MTGPSSEQATRQVLLPIVYGFALSQIAGTAVRLGVFEALGDSALPVEELAAATGAQPDPLARLLRAGVGAGLLAFRDDGRVVSTPLGRMLRSDSGWPLHRFLTLYGDPAVWRAWGALEDAVRTGKPAFDLVHGTPLFDHLPTDDRLAARFHAAMAAGTAMQNPVIARSYDFGRFEQIVDVGGGNGTLLATVLAAHPEQRGTLFDSTAALRNAPSVLSEFGVADRCSLVAGDFFASVPEGGDAYLLKNVLHDWNDQECVVILRNCRNAMSPGGRVLVLSALLPEQRQAPAPSTVDPLSPEDTVDSPEGALFVLLQDIEMMVMTTGRERTVSDYARLLGDADLVLGEVIPLSTSSRYHLVEALPA